MWLDSEEIGQLATAGADGHCWQMIGRCHRMGGKCCNVIWAEGRLRIMVMAVTVIVWRNCDDSLVIQSDLFLDN